MAWSGLGSSPEMRRRAFRAGRVRQAGQGGVEPSDGAVRRRVGGRRHAEGLQIRVAGFQDRGVEEDVLHALVQGGPRCGTTRVVPKLF